MPNDEDLILILDHAQPHDIPDYFEHERIPLGPAQKITITCLGEEDRNTYYAPTLTIQNDYPVEALLRNIVASIKERYLQIENHLRNLE